MELLDKVKTYLERNKNYRFEDEHHSLKEGRLLYDAVYATEKILSENFDTDEILQRIDKIKEQTKALIEHRDRLELALVNEKILTQKLKETNEALEFHLRQTLIS